MTAASNQPLDPCLMVNNWGKQWFKEYKNEKNASDFFPHYAITMIRLEFRILPLINGVLISYWALVKHWLLLYSQAQDVKFPFVVF